ncbi:MAG: hypothetical protein LBU60_03585 [Clostridiales bacterium]|jgi:dipicolinate synthase subunit A|nr:hypothetical protein [Clostridiales bacterium]
MIPKQVLIDLSDNRNKFLLTIFADYGFEVSEFKHKFCEPCLLLLAPTSRIPLHIPSNSIVFCNKCDDIIENYLLQKNVKVLKYFDDPILAVQNSNLTAQGALAKIIQNTYCGLQELNVLILGNGKLGFALLHLLSINQCKVDVLAKRHTDMYSELLSSRNLYNFGDNLDYFKYNTVINTIPCRVFDDKIKYLNRHCYILDLSSNPGGVSQKIATKLGLHLEHYLGVPGKVAPKTSAEYTMQSILKRLNAENFKTVIN